MAVGQLIWGVVQPVFGALADRWGSYRVIVLGAILLSAGFALTPLASSDGLLVLTMGVLTAAGAGAGSFSILMGIAAKAIPPDRRSVVAGFINAGGSIGQFIFAPLSQAMIAHAGWVWAMLTMAVAALCTIPIAWPLRHEAQQAPPRGTVADAGLGKQIRRALHDPSYLCLHAGFFTCGFHVAFLITHLPGEVALSGHSARSSPWNRSTPRSAGRVTNC